MTFKERGTFLLTDPTIDREGVLRKRARKEGAAVDVVYLGHCWAAMAIPTLYDMCQFQTIVNVRTGLWSQCQENPFTRVPPKLVNKLWEFMFSLNFQQLPSHEALHLMFTSPRLKKLDLSCFP
ncbi:hypothetical protein CEXT_670961 [Caerostris extrusa]|uniref:Uncharacterized protein n=1 Tax=Caerostris extrusa TaxID=172846 RepID=A0AAV4U6B9_CAEEX|nr:hypothetical protein CEXT_670961 [Caerostris extrusa]